MRESAGWMIPSSHTRPVAYSADDSFSICASSSSLPACSCSSSTDTPRPADALRATMSITPASWRPPITAILWFGQEKMNRGS